MRKRCDRNIFQLEKFNFLEKKKKIIYWWTFLSKHSASNNLDESSSRKQIKNKSCQNRQIPVDNLETEATAVSQPKMGFEQWFWDMFQNTNLLVQLSPENTFS